MADSRSIVTLNVGSQTVGLGTFSRSKSGGLILKKYENTSILLDPAVEASRLPQIQLAVNELAQKCGVAKQKVDYAISGQAVFVRFVKLPMLDDGDLEQLVAFEAQQHVPFPINEVIWDWQLLESTGPEKEVVLVAVRIDALEELNHCVSEANLVTGCVDTSPMALANSFAYNYGGSEETSLLIDIGARTSNLIYLEGKKVFVRSIPMGGVAITSAIAKEYKVPYAEAESQKISNGMVALSTYHTSELDESTGALATCIRTALNRMPAEIARTTNFYRSQHGGNAPKRVYLAGGGANLSLINDFFEEKLRLPVEYFNPLNRISVAKSVDMDQILSQAHQMGELVGLALRSIGEVPIQVDLEPESVHVERVEKSRRPYLIAAAVLILLAFGIVYAVTSMRVTEELEKLQVVDKRVDALEAIAYPIEEELKRKEVIKSFATQFVDAHKGQRYWLELYDDLKQRFGSTHVWITDLSPLVNYSFEDENITEAIRGDFAKIQHGSSLTKLKDLEPEFLPPNNRPNRNYVAPVINALKIRGFWRGADGAAKVNALVKKLTTDSKFFTLEVVNEKGEPVVMEPRQYAEIESMLGEKNFAAPYQIVIPLKQPISLK